MVMGIVYWTLMIGFLIGALTKLFFRRIRQGQIYSVMTASLIGSVAAGGIGERIGLYEFGNQNSLIASLIGAIVAVGLYCYYFTKNARSPRAFKTSRR